MLGSARNYRLLTTLCNMHAAGRCPFDDLVEFFPHDHNQDPIEASCSGAVIKPISTMPT